MDWRGGDQLMAKRYICDTNLFDPGTVSLDTRIYWNNGQEFQTEGWSITDYIPVNQGWSYHSEGLLKYMIVGYDENKQYLGVYNATIDSFDKSSAAINWNINSFTNSSAYGVSYIRLYANFYFPQGFEFYENAHWEPCAVKRYHKSLNRIDESKITNELLDTSSGTTTPDSNYRTTDYILLESFYRYRISLKSLENWAETTVSLAFYDSDKGYSSGWQYNLSKENDQRLALEFFAEQEPYIRLCWNIDGGMTEPMLNRGFVIPYEPYGDWHDADEAIRQNGVWVQQ